MLICLSLVLSKLIEGLLKRETENIVCDVFHGESYGFVHN